MDVEHIQQILGNLARHRADFHGVKWRPRRLIGTYVIGILLEVVTEYVFEVLELPLDKLPSSGKLLKHQHELRLAYEQIRRNRLYNQAEFFRQIGVVFDQVGKVFEELARLKRTGYLSPELEQEKTNGKN